MQTYLCYLKFPREENEHLRFEQKVSNKFQHQGHGINAPDTNHRPHQPTESPIFGVRLCKSVECKKGKGTVQSLHSQKGQGKKKVLNRMKLNQS